MAAILIPRIRPIICFKYVSRALHLLLDKAIIDGQLVAAKSGKTFEVKNPSTNKPITCVPDMEADDVEMALKAAYIAFESFQYTTAKDRSYLLRRWFNLLECNKASLGMLITAESGKPFSEACGEVTYGNSFVEWFADTARHINGEVVQCPWVGKEMIMTKEPIGVISVITPWNFPVAMITRKVSALIAAGCTCVIKPAQDTPLSALAAVKLALEAGFPDGVVNVVTTQRKNDVPVGTLLCTSSQVAGISFTGSTQVGRILFEWCSKGIKRMALELGGNAPFLVFPTANLDLTIAKAMVAKFRNNGQSCVAANRFVLHQCIHDPFVCGLKAAVEQQLKMGDGMTDGVNVGPLINKSQLERVKRLVDDAVKKGANVVTGGKPAKEIGETFYPPTILTGITPDMSIYYEEVFGPVASCIKFGCEQEAVDIANDTRNGLASYIFSNNFSEINRVARKIKFGIVGINEGLISSPEPAFGGVKEAGLGREGSTHGTEEFTYIKYRLLSPAEV